MKQEQTLDNGQPVPGLSKRIGSYGIYPIWRTTVALTPSARLVDRALCDFADASTDQCWPSYNTLAQRTGLSRRTVMKMIKELEEKGLIEVSRSKTESHRNRPNVYNMKRSKKGTGGSYVIQFGPLKGKSLRSLVPAFLAKLDVTSTSTKLKETIQQYLRTERSKLGQRGYEFVKGQVRNRLRQQSWIDSSGYDDFVAALKSARKPSGSE